MILFWGSFIGTVVVLGGLWLLGRSDFERNHARKRAQVLNALRYAACIALLLSLLWVVPRSPLSWAVAFVVVVLFLFPERWLLRIGGREPKWELRALQDAAGELTRSYPPPRRREFVLPMERLIGRMKAITEPEIAEMRDLLVADFSDSLVGTHHFSDLGLRAVRIHQIEVEVFGPDARRAELDPAEATFRWHLYRTFGDMIDCGAAREPHYLARMTELIEELEQYRRPDTEVFVDALQSSARDWLNSETPASWPVDGVLSLGPTVEESFWRLWPRKSVFWGTDLDERDAWTLQQLTRQAEPTSTEA